MDLIQLLQFALKEDDNPYPFPTVLKDSFQLIQDFFSQNVNHKLCIVFPTKEFAAQWLSIPTVLFLIKSDFNKYKNEIVEALEKYSKGDKLILNNEAVVEWIGK